MFGKLPIKSKPESLFQEFLIENSMSGFIKYLLVRYLISINLLLGDFVLFLLLSGMSAVTRSASVIAVPEAKPVCTCGSPFVTAGYTNRMKERMRTG